MRVDYKTIFSQAKIINKPWGNEKWIEDATITPYAFKKIQLNEGFRTSLQVHRHKIETNYIISGHGLIIIGNHLFPIDRYIDGDMPDAELDEFIEDVSIISVTEGSTFTILPGIIHRVIAGTGGLVFVEASSNELDDVIRLSDDTNRYHGKIKSEHE